MYCTCTTIGLQPHSILVCIKPHTKLFCHCFAHYPGRLGVLRRYFNLHLIIYLSQPYFDIWRTHEAPVCFCLYTCAHSFYHSSDFICYCTISRVKSLLQSKRSLLDVNVSLLLLLVYEPNHSVVCLPHFAYQLIWNNFC